MKTYSYICDTRGCSERAEITAASQAEAMQQLRSAGWGSSPVRKNCPGHEARVRLMFSRR